MQDGENIYYVVYKDIPMGAELLVWYGETYMQFMGIPVTVKDGSGQKEVGSEPESKQNLLMAFSSESLTNKWYILRVFFLNACHFFNMLQNILW